MKSVFLVGLNTSIVGKCDPQKVSGAGAWKQELVSLQQLADHVSAGYPWMPALLGNEIREGDPYLYGSSQRWQRNANRAYILALDIDEGMTIEQALDHPYISANFCLGQPSSSHKPERHKFRLSARPVEPIEGWEQIRICNQYLAYLVGSADPACKDASRFFFGAKGKQPFLFNESARLPADFVDQANAWHEEQERIYQEQIEAQRKKWEAYRAANPVDDQTDLVTQAWEHIPPYAPGNNTYPFYVAAAMGTINELGHGGRAIIESWSGASLSEFKGGITRWLDSLDRSQSGGRQASLGSVFKFAKDNGFRFPHRSGQGFGVVDKKIKKAPKKPNTGSPKPNSHYSGNDEPTPARQIIDLGDDEFFNRLDDIPRSGLVALKGQPGSGKTTAIAEIVKSTEFKGNEIALSVTHLESLGRQHAVDCNGGYMADVIVTDDHRVFNESTNTYVDFLAVCAPSLAKCLKLYGKILIIDEPYPLFEFILSSQPCKDERAFIIQILADKLLTAELIIVAGAEIDEALLTQLEALSGRDAVLIESGRQALPYPVEMLGGKLDESICDYLDQAQSVEDGKISMLFCDTRSTQEMIALRLEELGIKCFVHNGDTSGDALQKSYASSSGLDIPKLIKDGYRAFLHTPSCGIGISIKNHTDLIDGDIYCLFEARTITPEGMAQMCDRVRSDHKRRVFCHEKGRGYSRLTPLGKQTTDPAEFLADLHADSSAAIRRMHHAITGSVYEALYQDSCDSPWYWLLAEIETRRNRLMLEPRDYLASILRGRGKKVSIGVTLATDTEVKELKQAKARIKDKKKSLRIERILSADELNQSQVEAIKSRGSITSKDHAAIEKFGLRDFYHQPITAELIERDKEGARRRCIKLAEALLDEQTAIDQTRQSVERNAQPTDYGHHPGLKSDIDKTHWRYSLLEASGFRKVFLRIWNGGGDITDHEIESICDYATRHKAEFARSGLCKIEGATDRNIIGVLFRHVGLGHKRIQYRDNGQRLDRYELDTERLEAMQQDVEIRHDHRESVSQQADQNQDNNMECCATLTSDPAYLDELDMWQAAQNADPETKKHIESVISPSFAWLMRG